MNLLTPLYVVGALAVALPVIFHLLRRTPTKRQTFSSLMFLTPTPPRFTRRSRVSNWLLLLLRAALLVLLALAFGRPFFERDVAVAAGGPAGRRVAILVDTSASMRREDLWQQAKARVEDVLRDVGPADTVSLAFFDRTVRDAVAAEQWNRLDPAQRFAAVRAQVDAAAPTSRATDLGDAVAEAAERLAADDSPGRAAGPRTLVLISDLQQGGRPEALQSYAWPESVRLDVRPVAAKSPGNAGVQAVRPSSDAPAKTNNGIRVRIGNDNGATADQFTITWANAAGPVANAKSQPAYVPPGRGQVVRVDPPPGGMNADRLLLSGDAHDFDNTLFIAPRRQQAVRVIYAGNDSPGDTAGLLFYLRTALGETPQRRVEVLQRMQGADVAPEKLSRDDFVGTDLVVVTRTLPKESRSMARNYLEAGGDVLCVLPPPPQFIDTIALTEDDGWKKLGESDGNFSLLARLDTSHALLAAFADPRFGDFGRVHFWKHRRVTPPAGAKVLASFDNGDPWLIEQFVGRGRLFVMTSGWQPADCQLALSPKFVPILDGLLRPREGVLADTQYTVGDTLRVPADATKPWSLTPPAGAAIPLAAGTSHTFDTPGLYTLTTAAGPFAVAVNLRPDESRTTPVSAADFAQWGAKFVERERDPAAVADERHQAKRAELENHQKLWQWLIVGALGFVAAETFLAGRMSRRAAVPSAAPNG